MKRSIFDITCSNIILEKVERFRGVDPANQENPFKEADDHYNEIYEFLTTIRMYMANCPPAAAWSLYDPFRLIGNSNADTTWRVLLANIIRNIKMNLVKMTDPLIVGIWKDPLSATMAISPGTMYVATQFAYDHMKDLESAKVLVGTLLHEAYHVYHRHMITGLGKDPLIWNIATDAEINYILKHKLNCDLPEGGINPDIDGKVSFPVNNITVSWNVLKGERLSKPAEEMYVELYDSIYSQRKNDPNNTKKVLNVGDVCYNNKTGKYGKIIKDEQNNWKVIEITEDEARVLSGVS